MWIKAPNVNVYKEILGKTKDGADIRLSDYLVFKVVDIDESVVGTYTRETAMEAAGTVKGLKEYNGETKSLVNTNDANYVALVIYMPTSVGNEANYAAGAAVPTINLGLNLFATQYTSEKITENYIDEKDKETPEAPLFVINNNNSSGRLNTEEKEKNEQLLEEENRMKEYGMIFNLLNRI